MSASEDMPLTRALAVANLIKPLLAGHGPDVQGVALAELVALHLAGHPPQLREALLSLHVDCVRRLIPIVESETFGPGGHPGGVRQ